MSRLADSALLRRRALLSLMLASMAGMPGSCPRPARFSATFLQIWRDHLDLPVESWQSRLSATRQLGCREIILQWSSVRDRRTNLVVPDDLISTLFDICEELGMKLRVGLPYDERWWLIVQDTDLANLDSFLAKTHAACVRYMQNSPWAHRRAFAGWYIPYEIEQHSWVDPQRRLRLLQWLRSLANACTESSAIVPAISTYVSQLSPATTLAGLWLEILQDARLHPMIQDGVGARGLGAYVDLEPLRKHLLARNLPFDLIIELFEEIPSASPTDPARFSAQSATYARIHTQLQIAENYGAQQIVAFAVDPWMIGDSAAARRLLRSWRAVYP